MATVGAVSNPDNSNQNSARPGMWLKGIRPKVRGVVMNPIDHRMAAAKADPGGRHPVTPWASRPTCAPNTNKATTKFILRSRHRRTSAKEPHVTVCLKGPSSICSSAEEGREGPRVGPQRSHQDPVAPVDDPAAVRRSDLRRLNGKKHIPVNVTEDMIGQKFGEYRRPGTYYGHAADKKAKRK